MTNWCGECSLCCKLLGIEEIDKPVGVWCPHCTPGSGCRIHNQPHYPADCASYVCLWRQMKDEGVSVPDELRPDRSKVIIDAANFENAHHVRCDPSKPDAWRNPMIQGILGSMMELGSAVYLIKGDTRKRLRALVNTITAPP